MPAASGLRFLQQVAHQLLGLPLLLDHAAGGPREPGAERDVRLVEGVDGRGHALPVDHAPEDAPPHVAGVRALRGLRRRRAEPRHVVLGRVDRLLPVGVLRLELLRRAARVAGEAAVERRVGLVAVEVRVLLLGLRQPHEPLADLAARAGDRRGGGVHVGLVHARRQRLGLRDLVLAALAVRGRGDVARAGAVDDHLALRRGVAGPVAEPRPAAWLGVGDHLRPARLLGPAAAAGWSGAPSGVSPALITATSAKYTKPLSTTQNLPPATLHRHRRAARQLGDVRRVEVGLRVDDPQPGVRPSPCAAPPRRAHRPGRAAPSPAPPASAPPRCSRRCAGARGCPPPLRRPTHAAPRTVPAAPPQAPASEAPAPARARRSVHPDRRSYPRALAQQRQHVGREPAR